MNDEDKSEKYFSNTLLYVVLPAVTASLVLGTLLTYSGKSKSNESERLNNYQERDSSYLPVIRDNGSMPRLKALDLSYIAEEDKNLEKMLQDSLTRLGSIR